MPVSDEVIVTRLRALLQEVDLQTTSERKLRETIEAELKEDLSERKALIRQEVQAYLQEQQDEEENEDEHEHIDNGENGATQADAEGEDSGNDIEEQEEKEKKSKRKRKSAFGSKLSLGLQEFLGETSMPRTEVVKKMWEYIKANNLQNPKNKRKIILDDKLKKIFKPPLDMFSMNKQLSKHVYVNDSRGDSEAEEAEDEEDDDDDDEDPPQKKAPSKRKAGAQKGGDAKEPKKKRASTNGSGGGSALSAPLQEFLGVERLARAQVMKQLWEYIRANNLQDPANKRNIIVDKKLGTLFKAPLDMFNINKQITPHFPKGFGARTMCFQKASNKVSNTRSIRNTLSRS
ncbi:g1726 [Coccomyxa elongata]